MPIKMIFRQAPVTTTVIALCCLVALLSRFDQIHELTNWLRIHTYFDGRLELVTGGQFWRLVTPIFIHFSFAHLAFNMLWTWVYGQDIERYFSSLQLVIVIAVTAIASNIAQLYLAHANFGGMSGVVYGLMGFNWVLHLRHNRSPSGVIPQREYFLLFWLVLGWTGILEEFIGVGIANWAHTVGLVSGAALALVWPKPVRGRR